MAGQPEASWIAEERQRALDLLALAGPLPADMGSAEPEPRSVGAAYGFSLSWSGVEVRVYIFPAWGEGNDRVASLTAEAAGAGGREVRTAVNGRLLAVGEARPQDREATSLLEDLISAFAGWE